MVALGVRLGETYVFVHVESEHVLEAYATFLVGFNQSLIHTDRRRTGGKTQYERFFSCGVSCIDFVNNVLSSPVRQLFVIGFDDNSHVLKLIILGLFVV